MHRSNSLDLCDFEGCELVTKQVPSTEIRTQPHKVNVHAKSFVQPIVRTYVTLKDVNWQLSRYTLLTL